MNNIFEQATRQKLRFATPRGQWSTEDLWDASLADLDEIAKSINRKLKESSEESFVKKQTVADKKLTLSLDVVVSIINTKLADEERRKTAAERKRKRDKLIELISVKEDDAMQRKSLASLRAELDKLDDEDEATNE